MKFVFLVFALSTGAVMASELVCPKVINVGKIDIARFKTPTNDRKWVVTQNQAADHAEALAFRRFTLSEQTEDNRCHYNGNIPGMSISTYTLELEPTESYIEIRHDFKTKPRDGWGKLMVSASVRGFVDNATFSRSGPITITRPTHQSASNLMNPQWILGYIPDITITVSH